MKKDEDFGLPKKFDKDSSKSCAKFAKYFWYIIFAFAITIFLYYVIKKVRRLTPVQIKASEKNISEQNEDSQVNEVIVESFSEKGVFKINNPSGFYYVVVGSFINAYQAEDLIEKLKSKFNAIYYLSKEGDVFSYIAVEKYNKFSEANEAKSRMMQLGFIDSWIIKY